MIGDTPESGPDPGKAYLAYCRRRLSDEYLPRLLRCLDELSDEDLWWRPNESANSVGNLVLHLSGNVEQWINGGLGGASSVRDRGQEFSRREALSKTELGEIITGVLRRADETLSRFDPARLLERRRIQVYDVTCLDALSHVLEHFAQHLGQIVYVTKMRRDVDLRFYDL
ncbi:MAG TPA: DUF1572 family protein [Bacteroidota bacterium]|nr:DUF1572 family protein [Bacteroidota bacterium]